MSQSKWSRTINFAGVWKYISFMLSVYIYNNDFGNSDRVFEIELVRVGRSRVVIMIFSFVTHFRTRRIL